MIDYFQHYIPASFDKLQSYQNYYSNCYQYSRVDFSKYDLMLNTQNTLNIKTQFFDAESKNICFESKSSNIDINVIGSLKLASPVLSCHQQQAYIHIDNSGITLNAKHIVLESKSVKTLCGISCKGDTHSCPQQNGPGDLHVGGIIQSGSKNVFINNKAIARHGDFAPCTSIPNYIISHIHSITVNNRPIAHQFANTQHQGKITSNSVFVKIAPIATYVKKNINQSAALNFNELYITLLSIGTSTVQPIIYLKCKDTAASAAVQNNIGIISSLSQDDLCDVIQVAII